VGRADYAADVIQDAAMVDSAGGGSCREVQVKTFFRIMHIASNPGVMRLGSPELDSVRAVAAQVTPTPGTQLVSVQPIPFKAKRHGLPDADAVGGAATIYFTPRQV